MCCWVEEKLCRWQLGAHLLSSITVHALSFIHRSSVHSVVFDIKGAGYWLKVKVMYYAYDLALSTTNHQPTSQTSQTPMSPIRIQCNQSKILSHLNQPPIVLSNQSLTTTFSLNSARTVPSSPPPNLSLQHIPNTNPPQSRVPAKRKRNPHEKTPFLKVS